MRVTHVAGALFGAACIALVLRGHGRTGSKPGGMVLAQMVERCAADISSAYPGWQTQCAMDKATLRSTFILRFQGVDIFSVVVDDRQDCVTVIAGHRGLIGKAVDSYVQFHPAGRDISKVEMHMRNIAHIVTKAAGLPEEEA